MEPINWLEQLGISKEEAAERILADTLGRMKITTDVRRT